MIRTACRLILIPLLALTTYSSRAEEPPALPLWPADQLDPKPDPSYAETTTVRPEIGRLTSKVSEPTITVYPAPADHNTGCAIVICPGGGYSGLAIDWEGHNVARWLNTQGITGVVLKYRLPRVDITKDKTPLPLLDSRRAIQIVRAKAAEWKVDPKRVGIMGFSAGGHLASTTGTHLEKPDERAPDPIARQSSRPDFMVLVYPVITFEGPSAHTGSRNNLIGKDADEKMVELYSNEKQVTKETPPTLLVHAADDPVKVENSRLFFDALREKKIPCEFLEFGSGGHGFGLGNGSRGAGATAAWPAQCIAWLHSQKFLDAK
jgi:acetyl esterase/lipase